MRVSARRLAVTVLSALTAATAFTAPANAHSHENQISVREIGHISESGHVTLFGTYRCEPSSPRGVQIQVTLTQDSTRLGFGGEEAVCDGVEHDWSASASLELVNVHPGAAGAQARLQAASLHSGFKLSVAYLAETGRDIWLEEKHG
ncbi:DUF6299 family protein [Streptomyces sp. NBC_01006]|uniref:DUF6299 family protein n=1 Tax=Streptomyces sp. NBC_01006 TaxID=2903716 RepID=UPI003865BD77|nr:DUF6299 family protein [Streptomyces sp. NBC_01006]